MIKKLIGYYEICHTQTPMWVYEIIELAQVPHTTHRRIIIVTQFHKLADEKIINCTITQHCS